MDKRSSVREYTEHSSSTAVPYKYHRYTSYVAEGRAVYWSVRVNTMSFLDNMPSLNANNFAVLLSPEAGSGAPRHRVSLIPARDSFSARRVRLQRLLIENEFLIVLIPLLTVV